MLILFQFEKITIRKHFHFKLTTIFFNITENVMICKEELDTLNKTFDNLNAPTGCTQGKNINKTDQFQAFYILYILKLVCYINHYIIDYSQNQNGMKLNYIIFT